MFWAALVFLLALCRAQEITNLPGLGFKINFSHYSGFLNVSKTHYLHYWFVESQSDPERDPLIFWFNGGPGCSSLVGLLKEMGPYLVNSDGRTLRRNPYSWNTLASVVYVESPAGVGYSYATDGNITTNDDQTSVENYEAVKGFFKIFPKFRNHTVFLMGESYGAVYTSTLIAKIMKGQNEYPINVKGMALGNGYVDKDINFDSFIKQAYGRGMVDESFWNQIRIECCEGCIDTCDFSQVYGECLVYAHFIQHRTWFSGLNPYDIYRDCDPTASNNSKRFTQMMRGVAPGFELLSRKNEVLMNFLQANEPRYGSPLCINDSDIIAYMNDDQVRAALNISTSLPKWDVCSTKVGISYRKQYSHLAPFVQKIVEANISVLLYYGDTDMACNFMMGQRFSNLLGLKRVSGKEPWIFDGQVAGFKTLFAGLTFVTVKGAGHLAPLWKAPQTQYVIQQFLSNNTI